MKNKKCKKNDILRFLNVLVEHFIFYEKIRGRMVAQLTNVTRMRPGQVWVRQTQNLTANEWRRMPMCSTWLALGLAFPSSVVINILAGSQTQTYNFVREPH